MFFEPIRINSVFSGLNFNLFANMKFGMSFRQFLCRHSVAWVYAFARTTSPPKLQYQRHAVFLKDTLTIEDEKLFRPCRSVHSSVPQSHYKSGTPTQSVKISTLYHNFLIHYCRDFSHILHICTRLLVDYLV